MRGKRWNVRKAEPVGIFSNLITRAMPGMREYREATGDDFGQALGGYGAFLQSAGMTPQEFVRGGTVAGPDGQRVLVNPQTGVPYATPGAPRLPGQPARPTTPPLSNVPSGGPFTAPPAFAPPALAMPSLLPNPTPQGAGGMPMIRDRMMAAALAPLTAPNWGIPQVPAQYLTQQMPLPGGSTAGIAPTPPQFGNPRDVLGGWMRIPTRPPAGMAI